jgi:acetyltransferase
LSVQQLDEKSIRERYTSSRLLKNNVKVTFRPIECGDREKHRNFFKSLSPASVHFRFLELIKDLSEAEVEKFCNINYRQEMAIVAVPKDEDKIVAVARLILDEPRKLGEFAIVIADLWQGLGLGWEMLDFIIWIARDYELVEIHCFVSSDNDRMIALAKKAGFKTKSLQENTLDMHLMLDNSETERIA